MRGINNKVQVKREEFAVEILNDILLQMYRNKSAVSLRSLAQSVKQSIAMDLTRGKSRQFIPLRRSSSTVNLPNNKNRMKVSNFDNDYLILLDTRKSRMCPKSITNRESNLADCDWGYNAKSTRQIMIQKKEKLSDMTKRESHRGGLHWHQSNTLHDIKHRDQISFAMQVLEKQHAEARLLYQQIINTQNLQNHGKLLQDSDNLATQLNKITARQSEFIEHEKQLTNRLQFLKEQISSIEMNFTEHLAQKQYCEQFLHQYQHSQENRFRDQAQCVVKMIQLQLENHYIENQKIQMQSQLEHVESEFKLWKAEENLQLKQRRFENRFKENRIQLMKIQHDLDHLTQEIIAKTDKQSFDYSIRKVRQYICSYFKKYNQININHISHGQIADGIDIFLCKEGLIKDFTKFLKDKTDKQSKTNGTYSLKLIQYCDCLKKIQNLFSVQKAQVNTVLTRKFEQKIIALKQKLQTINAQRQKNLLQIKELQENIEIVLAQQSLSMIQLINKGDNSQLLFSKKQGFFNMHQIKARVKEMKLQQIKRISRVKEIYLKLNKLEQKQTTYSELNHKRIQTLLQQKQLLTKEMTIWYKKISEIRSIKKGYESKKQKCDELIDGAITKMKQKDQVEIKLSTLQREIQHLKKEKVEKIKAKHLQSNNLDLLGCLRERMSKKQNLEKRDLFEQTKKMPQNFLTDRFIKNPKIQTLKPENSRKNEISWQEKASAEFCIRKNEQDENMSNKTQSSLKSSKERVSLRTLNSIILSKCNLVESKNMPHKKQSSHKPIQQSARSVKQLNKQNISRKTSTSKNTQRSTIRNIPKTTLPIKLILEDTNRITQTARLERNYTNFPNSQRKAFQHKVSKRDSNSIISNKLLKR